MERLSLDGDWRCRRADGGSWFDARVPGGVYSDLLRAGEIPDPYEDDNELDVQWVGESDWTYRRTVDVDSSLLDHERVTLVCHGLDTVAEVFVDGERVGRAENMHRRYEYDVTDALHAGENDVEVRFRSPVEYGLERAAAYPRDVPTTRYPVDQPARNFVRKAQCHYGWDWGACLPTTGVWKSVELVAHSAPRVRYVATSQDHSGEGVALTARVGVDAPRAGEYELALSVAGETVTERVALDGEDEAEATVEVPDPDLWWPAGYGDQPLYDLEVTVSDGEASDATTERVGFREVAVDRQEDGDGFAFVVNGTPVFAKGANWIPVDLLYDRQTPERYADLLESAVDANMNAVRVWGGGFYERDVFYDLCDELGLLVWQDFMFACSLYPADEEFLANVEAEVRDQVRRLGSHPSVALWCGNNENEEALLNWYDLDDPETYREAYDALYLDTVGEAVRVEDPDRTYWPSSPHSGEFGDPYDPDRGDVHYWDVWHGGEPFSDYLTVEPRFVSEFGYQSFPSTETLGTVLDEEQFNPTAPLMEHHQRHPEGNALILARMADHFRFPFDFESFVYLSQIQQGLAMETAIEGWRRLKPRCMGTLYWQLNDLWPVASWSSLEYGGRWKALHHFARRFYAPVLPSLVDGDGGVEVWLTSDVAAGLDGEVVVSAHRLDGGCLSERRLDADLPALASERLATLDREALLDGRDPEDVLLRVRYDGPEESHPNHLALVPYKRLALPETDLDVTAGDGAVTVAADGAALFVALETDADGRFEDNYFHLLPGESRTVGFEADGEGASLDVAATHLRETY
ncbi:MAG: glycoside hydrolase family 2 protein [Halobacteriaceae archaeon]